MTTIVAERKEVLNDLSVLTEKTKIYLISLFEKINYLDSKNRKVIICEPTYSSTKYRIGSFSFYLPINDNLLNIDFEMVSILNYKLNINHGGILVNDFINCNSKSIIDKLMNFLEVDDWESKFKITNL